MPLLTAPSVSGGYIGAAKQSVKATGVAPSLFARVKSATYDEQMDIKQLWDGQHRDPSLNIKLAQWGKGTMQMYLTPDVAMAYLAWFLGGTDTVTGAGDPYVHAFQSVDTAPPYISIEKEFGLGIDVLRTIDQQITGWKLDAGGTAEPTVTVTHEGGATIGQSALATVTFEVDGPLSFVQATNTWTGLALSAGQITSLTIDAKYKLNSPRVDGNLAPQHIVGSRQIDLSFTAFVPNNQVIRQIYFGGTAATAAVNSTTVLTTLVSKFDLAGTPDHFVQFTLNGAVMMQGTPQPVDASLKEFVINCKGTLQAVGGTPAMSVSVSNAHAGAYL